MPSGYEWLIVLGVIALLFGGAKLPKLARSLGSAKGEFEKGLKDGEKASKSAEATAPVAPAAPAAPAPAAPAPELSHEAKIAEAEARAAEAEAAAARAKAEAARLAAEVHKSEA